MAWRVSSGHGLAPGQIGSVGLIRSRFGAVDRAQNAAQGHYAQEYGQKNVDEKKGVSGHGGIR